MDGESCKDYLSRREGWKDLKEMMLKKEGANIVPYSFRHYYSLRGHIAVLILEVWQRVWVIQ